MVQLFSHQNGQCPPASPLWAEDKVAEVGVEDEVAVDAPTEVEAPVEAT